jgi:hypothetical protein
VVKKVWVEFILAEFGTFFPVAQDPREVRQNGVGPWMDSTRQIGLEITLTRVLIVVESWYTRGKNGSVFAIWKLEPSNQRM